MNPNSYPPLITSRTRTWLFCFCIWRISCPFSGHHRPPLLNSGPVCSTASVLTSSTRKEPGEMSCHWGEVGALSGSSIPALYFLQTHHVFCVKPRKAPCSVAVILCPQVKFSIAWLSSLRCPFTLCHSTTALSCLFLSLLSSFSSPCPTVSYLLS